jgi:hypothetical protein
MLGESSVRRLTRIFSHQNREGGNITYATSIEDICSSCIFLAHFTIYSITSSSIAMKEPAPGPPLGPKNRKKFGILGTHIDKYAEGNGSHSSCSDTPSLPVIGVVATSNELPKIRFVSIVVLLMEKKMVETY